MRQLPTVGGGLNAFTDTGESDGAADNLWNPDIDTTTVGEEHAGFHTIAFEFKNTTGSDKTIYLDEVTVAEVVGDTGWVKRIDSDLPADTRWKVIYPTPDAKDSGMDTTLSYLVPTISVTLDTGGYANLANSDMFVIEEGYPTDNLADDPVRDDGSASLFVTPNDASDAGPSGKYAADSTIVVFIRPADAEGDFGMAEVITFNVDSSGVGTKVKTMYHSVRTD